MNDEKVLWAIKEKDEKMMAFVIQKYSKLLWKIASGVLINAASAEDIEECVADTFIHLWMNPHKYNPDKGKMSSYLSMVARSKAIDRYRQIAAKQEVAIEESIAYHTEVLAEIISREQKEKLLSCIEKLDNQDKDIIIRRFFYNQKPKAIAVALGLTGKQVENRLYQTKQKLRKMMEE